MGNPAEIQKPVTPETSESELNKEATGAESLGKAEVAQRLEAVINRMANIYRARIEQKIITKEDLTALSTDSNTPDWKKEAAKRALGSEKRNETSL